MAMNDMGNTPPNAGNDAPADEEYGAAQGEAVPCIHIYKMADGSFGVEEATAPPPAEGLQTLGSLEEVMAKVEESLTAPPPDDEAMTAAKAGYAKAANRPPMAAPNPGAIFGE